MLLSSLKSPGKTPKAKAKSLADLIEGETKKPIHDATIIVASCHVG
jgi:hypothetical protein